MLGGATAAGLVASACSLPFDFVKTRLQKMTPGPDGKMPYSGPIDCAMQVRAATGSFVNRARQPQGVFCRYPPPRTRALRSLRAGGRCNMLLRVHICLQRFLKTLPHH